MKKFSLIFIAVMLMLFCGLGGLTGEWSPDVYAADIAGMNLTGELKLGYPIETNTNNDDVFSVSLIPDYILDGELRLQANDSCAAYLELDITEGTSQTITYGADYYFGGGNFGVFAEYATYDMKRGRDDFELATAGFAIRLE